MLKKIVSSGVIKILSIMAPIGFRLVSRSPQLQSLAIEALSKHEFFSRNIPVISGSAAAKWNGHAGQSTANFLARVAQGLPRATVVVPVFNAFDSLALCLENLVRFTPQNVSVILVDDGSDSPGLADVIDSASRYFHDFRTIRNERNLGFTKSVNIALRVAAPGDVVLLNSDAIVTENWLERMRYVAYSHFNVATVTPISDNAGVFSVPVFGGAPVFDTVKNHRDYARGLTQAGSAEAIKVPTGNGFCMLITEEGLERIGELDAQKYPRGYGEENDFCMRALRANMLNLVTEKVFVYHLGSKSFGESKRELIVRGYAQLLEDYPEYNKLSEVFRENPFIAARERGREAALQLQVTSRDLRVLFIQPISGGGVVTTNSDLVRGLGQKTDIFMLKSSGSEMTFSRLNAGGDWETLKSESITPVQPVTHQSDSYDQQLIQFCFEFGIDLIHVEHLAWQSLTWSRAAKELGIAIAVSSHDYYTVCPSHNLLDEQLKGCGGICTIGTGQCNVTLWPSNALPPLKNQFVHRWREMNALFYEDADVVFAPSNFVKDVLQRHFPLLESRIVVVPHGREWPESSTMLPKDSASGVLRILVPGNLGWHKGLGVMEELSTLLGNEPSLEFHYVGEGSQDLLGVIHGPYKQEDFFALVDEIRPDIALIPSIADETFSHVLSECWVAGLPVIAFEVGAIGERIGNSKAGWTVTLSEGAAGLATKIKDIQRMSAEELGEISRIVNEFAKAETLGRSVDAMATDYFDQYLRAILETKRNPSLR